MHVSAKGRAFITQQEGCEFHAYRDATGVWTIGVGHTSMAGLPHVNPGMTITAAQADEILARDLVKFEAQVLSVVKYQLNQAQFDALVSFTYNCGEGSLKELVQHSGLNSGNVGAVPGQLEQFTHAGGHVLADLVRRRAAEAAMFAHGAYPA